MKKIFYVAIASVLMMAGCQQSAKESNDHQHFAEEAIKIHDEIMPQIAHFDRTVVKIDHILNNLDSLSKAKKDIDTNIIKSDLETLKTNLENATDNMMTWMRDYTPDSTDVAYQKAEIEKVKAMKKQFEDVSLESNNKLGNL